MTRRFARLAWLAATCTYLLIILGAIVRITGSGLGCGEHWPLCNGRLLPPLDLPTGIEDGHRLPHPPRWGFGCGEHWPLCNGRLLPPLDLPTVIEYGHRLAAAAVSVLVTALAAHAWWLRRGAGSGERYAPGAAAYVALALLVVQVLLGALTVKLSLPPWTVILHLGTAMLLLATLLFAAREQRLTPGASPGNTGAGPPPGSRPGFVGAIEIGRA